MSYALLKDPVGRCKIMTYTSAGAVVAGTMAVVNDMLVYNLSAAAGSGERVKGVFETGSNGIVLPKQAALAINAGDEVWWDTGADEIDTTNTNVNAGYCMEDAAASDSTVRIALINNNVG